MPYAYFNSGGRVTGENQWKRGTSQPKSLEQLVEKVNICARHPRGLVPPDRQGVVFVNRDGIVSHPVIEPPRPMRGAELHCRYEHDLPAAAPPIYEVAAAAAKGRPLKYGQVIVRVNNPNSGCAPLVKGEGDIVTLSTRRLKDNPVRPDIGRVSPERPRNLSAKITQIIADTLGLDLGSGTEDERVLALRQRVLERLSSSGEEELKMFGTAAVASWSTEENNEAMRDKNYSAYLRESTMLKRQAEGKLIVAYANGKRIAEGKSRDEVLSNIPSAYRGHSILLQEVPGRVIKVRRPLRVRRSAHR
jgi:hypothetical protein